MIMMRIAGVILAGGEGSRLGGVVKPLLRVGGTPILGRTIAALRPLVSPLLVSTGSIARARFAGFDCDGFIPDRDEQSAGPLAGIFAATAYLRTAGTAAEWLLSVAGDCPDLPQGLPEALLSAASPGVDVVFASFAGQAYPPNALWRFSALIEHFDAQEGQPQGKGPRQLIAHERRRDVDFSGRLAINPFEGLNTLADLVHLARVHQRGMRPEYPKTGLGKSGQTR
jgi:molybdopterin-guanine dinucleotide biosynthesis protein A